jgi:hypothetical protein
MVKRVRKIWHLSLRGTDEWESSRWVRFEAVSANALLVPAKDRASTEGETWSKDLASFATDESTANQRKQDNYRAGQFFLPSLFTIFAISDQRGKVIRNRLIGRFLSRAAFRPLEFGGEKVRDSFAAQQGTRPSHKSKPKGGIEPPTHALRMRCSTPELLRRLARP